MTITVTKTKVERYSFEGLLLKSSSSEMYDIVPAEGKALRNKQTRRIFKGTVSVDSREKALLYEEVSL